MKGRMMTGKMTARRISKPEERNVERRPLHSLILLVLDPSASVEVSTSCASVEVLTTCAPVEVLNSLASLEVLTTCVSV